MDFGPYVGNPCYMNSPNSPSPPVSHSALVQVLIIPHFRSYKGTAGIAAPCLFHIGSKNSNINHAFAVPVSPMASDCLRSLLSLTIISFLTMSSSTSRPQTLEFPSDGIASHF